VSEDDVLARAQQVWRSSGPSDDQIRRGALRVARKLRVRRRTQKSRTFWAMAGAVTACMATLAYAARGHLGGVLDTEHPALTPSDANAAETANRSGRSVMPNSLPPTRAVLAADSTDAPVLPPFASALDVQAPPAPARDTPPPSVAHTPQPSVAQTPLPSSTTTPLAHRSRESDRLRSAEGANASWRTVSDALAAGDEARAEQLLQRLAHHGRDADTRSKAKLGLAQLEASRGQCARARQLALAIASEPGTNANTVRRALDLAARCLH
jgi:hypothetical protein